MTAPPITGPTTGPTSVPTIAPSIRITETADEEDPAAPPRRTAEIAVDIAAGATRVHHRIVADCDTAAAAQAVLAAHLTGLAVALGDLADAPEAIRRTELVGGLDGWTATVEFAFHDPVADAVVPLPVTVPGALGIDDAKAKAAAILAGFAAELRKGQDTLVIRAAGRPGQIALLTALAESQPFVRAGCESCDVL